MSEPQAQQPNDAAGKRNVMMACAERGECGAAAEQRDDFSCEVALERAA